MQALTTTASLVRSVSLRLAAALTLALNVLLGHGQPYALSQAAVIIGYVLLSIGLAAYALRTRWQTRVAIMVALLDGLMVVAVLYANIVGRAADDDHGLTTSGLVVAFILLIQAGFALSHRQILAFGVTVLSTWLLLILFAAAKHQVAAPGSFWQSLFGPDLGLALSFGFTGVAVYLMARERSKSHAALTSLERQKHNLSRFFSPHVVADLQEASDALDLKRRNAAVMFIDIQDFTSYAERAPAAELAGVLSEYRRIVASAVFQSGGTVDKFMGDGVMAVFGQPFAREDDAARALSCAIVISSRLGEWREAVRTRNRHALQIGIGLHHGAVIGGVLESGYHDEFTVIGDAVNVAQRLQVSCKHFNARIVVSQSLLDQVNKPELLQGWLRKDNVTLRGRRRPIDVAYLPSDSGISRALRIPASRKQNATDHRSKGHGSLVEPVEIRDNRVSRP